MRVIIYLFFAIISMWLQGCVTATLYSKIHSNEENVPPTSPISAYKNPVDGYVIFGSKAEKASQPTSSIDYFFHDEVLHQNVVFHITDSLQGSDDSANAIAWEFDNGLSNENITSMSGAVFLLTRNAHDIYCHEFFCNKNIMNYDAIIFESGQGGYGFYIIKKGKEINKKSEIIKLRDTNQLNKRLNFGRLLNAGYIVTVPVDIVTSPIQLGIFIYLAFKVPGVSGGSINR